MELRKRLGNLKTSVEGLIGMKNCEDIIIELLQGNPQNPETLISLLKLHFSDKEIRRAIWNLLNKQKIEYTPDRKLKL